MVSSFRSHENATGYQKFFKLGWYDLTGPETFSPLLGNLFCEVSMDDEEMLGDCASELNWSDLLSSNSLSFTNFSMYANLSNAAPTLASDIWTWYIYASSYHDDQDLSEQKLVRMQLETLPYLPVGLCKVFLQLCKFLLHGANWLELTS